MQTRFSMRSTKQRTEMKWSETRAWVPQNCDGTNPIVGNRRAGCVRAAAISVRSHVVIYCSNCKRFPHTHARAGKQPVQFNR